MNTQKGFTLIELIAVMVILGILGAVAVPKFIDMSAEAEIAAMQGVVGAIESASAINYGACSAGNADCFAITAADTCAAAVAGIMSSSPTGYVISGTIAGAAGDASSCTVTAPAGQTVAAGTANVIVTQ